MAGSRTGPVSILANGASLKNHDLSKLGATFGMNRSWQLVPAPDYHIVADLNHRAARPDVYEKLSKTGVLFTLGAGWANGANLRIRHARVHGQMVFSDDITQGVSLGRGSIGTVAYSALQVAVWLGFDPIYFLGLDLGGPHFHGDWLPNPDIAAKQGPIFQFAADHLKTRKPPLTRPMVWNVGSPASACTAFPKLTFEEAFPRG